jgi:methylated-DNA-[protein]-cysteine S-methyltransferase
MAYSMEMIELLFIPDLLDGITLETGPRGLRAIYFSQCRAGSPPESDSLSVARQAERQLREYFAGQRRSFDVPLDLGGSSFQRSVWKALTEIPYGKTASYRDIAIAVNSPKGYRAIGQANNRNPIPIIVPCHRVIGADGSIGGYGGGVDRKNQLLELERRYAPHFRGTAA